MKIFPTLLAGGLLLLGGTIGARSAGAATSTTNTNFRGLPGLLFEAEDWSTPQNAWLTNQAAADKWRLWTTEGKGKRSRDAALVSPNIPRDRATPEEGAPPLHTHITGIPPGVYRAWLGPTTRPLAYSLDDGHAWLKSASGETDLGVYDIRDGVFNLWVDDRFANPASIGSTYYDYVRLEPFSPPQLSAISVFTRPDGTTQISWVTDVPTPPAVVECAARKFSEANGDVRNHRVTLTGLPAGQPCEARIRCLGVATPVKFVAGARPRAAASKAQTIELTISEPSGLPRKNWPVTSGVPFAQGALAVASDAALCDPAGQGVPAQFEATAFWPDGSIKWLQLSFLCDTSLTPVRRLLRIGGPVAAPAPATPVTVTETAGGWTLGNGPLSLHIGRKTFALFDGVTLHGQAVTGAPVDGNGHLRDASGKAYFPGAPDTVTIEEGGPIRAVVRVEGDFVAADGAKLFRWRARYFLCAGQPWLRLNWTIGNNQTNAVLTNIRDAGIRIPLAAHGLVCGAFTGAEPTGLSGQPPAFLLQDKDDHFTESLGGAQQSGQHAQGGAFVTDGTRRLAVAVPDFWQLYPKGLVLQPDGIQVQILPPLPADAFAKESQNVEDLIRLYYCYDHGQYRIKRGLEFTTDLCVQFGAEDDARFAAWAGQPLYAVAPPRHYCESGVFGIVEPRQAGLFDEYEQMAAKGFAQLEKNRLAKHEYGWMNFGDWHGERHFNWGNHEYDMMGALALQFIRTGDPQWLRYADDCARHSTSIDTVHYPWQDRMAGRVYAHSVGHVGGFFAQDDPRFRALGNIFGLPDPSHPNQFITGAIDAGGHIFQPGNFRVGFLTGERRYREVAEMVCAAQATYMTRNFDFGIERAAGWPLMNAVAAFEATDDPFFLNAAQLYVAKIVGKQTDRGDWGLAHGPPECLHQPPHPGGKAFAAGVLLNGLMMFDAVAPSAEVKQCIVRNAHWLENYSWNHATHSYRYIDTCPTYEKGGGNGGTDLLVSSGLAYACTLDSDPALRALLLDSLSRALHASSKLGKDYTQDIRQTPHALAILHQQLGVNALPAEEPKK
jgi:hypothetical protein